MTPEAATPKELERAAITISVADFEERVANTRDLWETDSMYEDILETLEQEPGDVPGSCTPEEASRLRRELRELGPVVFAQRTIDSGHYTARKLLTAFNLKPPAFLDGCPDEDYHALLTVAITRELAKRAKLTRYNTVNDTIHLLRRSSNVIVLTGAGISTSLGIPDFRSKGTGLYSTLEHLGLNDPQEVFDIHTFKEDPTIFYSVAKDIIPSTDRYTPTHKFIAMLHERGKLLTNYSQNIDNLEIAAGVPKDRLIQCHGSFGSATCVECGYKTAGEAIFPDTNAGIIPKCPRCTQRLRPAPPKRKRSSEGPRGRRRRRRNGHDDDDDDDDDDDPAYDIPQAGVMKPDITFFGEDLPDEFSKRLTDDREKVDLVVVIGTSLKVTPVSEIVGWLPSHIPQLYISRQALSHINFDIDLLGDCDIVIEELCRRLGWELKHEMVEPGRITIKTEEGYKSRHVFKKEKLIKLPKSVLEDQLAEKASIITAQEQALMKQDSFILNLQTRMFHMQKKIKVLVDCRRAAEDHHGNPNMQEQLRVQISALKQQLKDKTQLENDLEAIQTSQLGISFHEVILKFNSIQGFIEDACASVGPIDIPDPASKLGHDKIWSGTVELWAEKGSGLTIPNLLQHCLDMRISGRRLTRLLAASALCHLVFEPVFPTLLTIDSPLLDQYRRQILNKFGYRELYMVDSLAHKALALDGFFKSSTFKEMITQLQNIFSHNLQWLLGSQRYSSDGPEIASQNDEDIPPSVADAFKQTLKASLELKVELMVPDVYYLLRFFKPGDLFDVALMNYDGTVFADPATKRQRKTSGRSEQHTSKELVTLCIFPAIYASPRGIRAQNLGEESTIQDCVVDYTNFLNGTVSDRPQSWSLICKATVLVHEKKA